MSQFHWRWRLQATVSSETTQHPPLYSNAYNIASAVEAKAFFCKHQSGPQCYGCWLCCSICCMT